MEQHFRPGSTKSSKQPDTQFPEPDPEETWSFRLSLQPRQSLAPGLGLTAEPEAAANTKQRVEMNVSVIYAPVLILVANTLATA